MAVITHPDIGKQTRHHLEWLNISRTTVGIEQVHCVPDPQGKAAVVPTDLRRPTGDAEEAKITVSHHLLSTSYQFGSITAEVLQGCSSTSSLNQ